MERLRKNLAVKLTAYILMILCTIMMSFSAVVVFTNIVGEWYSVGSDAVNKDIRDYTAYAAESNLLQEIFDLEASSSDIAYTTEIIEEYDAGTDEQFSDEQSEEENSRQTIQQLLKEVDGELVTGETYADEFGYSIFPYIEGQEKTSVDYSKPIRQVHPELAKEEGVFIKTTNHSDFRIEVYLGELNEEELPDYVVPVYKYNKMAYEMRYIAIVTAVASFIAALFLLVFLITAAGENNKGNKNDYNERRAFAIKAVPLDIAMGAVIFICSFMFYWMLSGGSIESFENFDMMLAAILLLIVVISVLTSGYILLFAARVKLGSWWQSTVIYQCVKAIRWAWEKIKELFSMIPVVWKGALIVTAAMVAYYIIIIFFAERYCWYGDITIFPVGLVLSAVVLYAVLRLITGFKKLKEAGKHLAEGNLDYKVDVKGLILDLKEHGENLNSIGKGMETAVAAKMQSERFKNELITNVSHDLKTPLTSIINYVDLLKKEEPENETIREYIDVLDRQSQRLKRLTEDVVEASKVATGNVEINMTPCQMGVLMTQVMGEYSEKAEENDLDFIINIPKKDVKIMADGRRMWRVLNNLMSNICKYSMPGTRVYQNLEVCDGKAVITYKNISKYELNITGRELTERFVRGDSSRHTEGSGLGLSIAENLVELQKGEFNISIDGDLFKVTMKFDLLN